MEESIVNDFERQKELEEQEEWQELLARDHGYAEWLNQLEKQRNEHTKRTEQAVSSKQD
jgi:predicted acetyltransferase